MSPPVPGRPGGYLFRQGGNCQFITVVFALLLLQEDGARVVRVLATALQFYSASIVDTSKAL
eukprot:8105066-Lingulodinium_polyedra.AAC.1